jgi:chromosome partitioning protein
MGGSVYGNHTPLAIQCRKSKRNGGNAMSKCKIICVANQKGGTAKTTTAWNLGYALAGEGKSVLMIDNDPQGNLSMAFGIERPDELVTSMSDVMTAIMTESDIPDMSQYVRKVDRPGMTLDIIPANQNLSVTEINLRDETGGEFTLSELLNPLREQYQFIIIDTNPYLGLLTKNALTACDEVIIPVSPQLWSATGLTDLLQNIFKVRRKLNPKIAIGGILLTICDERTRLYKYAKALIDESYNGKVKIYNTHIPSTVKVGEANYSSLSVIEHDPSSRASIAYQNFAKEVMANVSDENKESGKAQATA